MNQAGLTAITTLLSAGLLAAASFLPCLAVLAPRAAGASPGNQNAISSNSRSGGAKVGAGKTRKRCEEYLKAAGISPGQLVRQLPTDQDRPAGQPPTDDALTGTYMGTFLFPNSSREVRATLKVDRNKFEVKATGRRKITGSITIEELTEERAAGEFLFDNLGRSVMERRSQDFVATLTTNGWEIQSSDEALTERITFHFIQENCPPCPYCKRKPSCQPKCCKK